MFYLADHHAVCSLKSIKVRISSFQWVKPGVFKLDGIWNGKYTLSFVLQEAPDAKIIGDGLTCRVKGAEYHVLDEVTISIEDPVQSIVPGRGFILLPGIENIRQ